MQRASAAPRIGIIVVAYNAHATLLRTLDRIPADFRRRITEIIICDDASHDDTFELGRTWAERPDSPTTHVLRHTKNLGYGGNQKAAYALAIEHGLDVVVLLHGDGQYAPEYLAKIVQPFEDTDCAAVFGSRMMQPGAAKRGGMPLYKRWGNRILTSFENFVLKTDLSEFHSGYRAYRTDILQKIPFEANSDGFDFDTQMIAQVLHAGGTITEVPIPTYYGDEICYVNGVRYARDVVTDVVSYRLAVAGFGVFDWVPTPDQYAFKDHDGSSHSVILEMLADHHSSRMLDIGCSGGLLAEKLRATGNVVVGLDTIEVAGVRDRTDAFFAVDLENGIPATVGAGYDVVIAGDVIEHLAHPAKALRQMIRVLRPGGQVILSVPNFAHWYPRIRTSLGVFGYDRRGILDETHLRHFTQRSLRRTVRGAGFDILEQVTTGPPFGAIVSDGFVLKAARKLDRLLVRARPTLFGYQFVLRLTPHAKETVFSDHLQLVTGDGEDEADSAIAK